MNTEKIKEVLIKFLLVILVLALLSKIAVHCNKETDETEMQRHELSDSTLINFSNNFIEDLDN